VFSGVESTAKNLYLKTLGVQRAGKKGRPRRTSPTIGHVRADLVARYNKDEAWAGRSDAFTRVSDHIATAIGGAAQFC
jgi:hypothetical protein